MNGTLELNGTIPAKLIIGNKELDVEIVLHTSKEYQHTVGIANIPMCVIVENTFTCVQRKYRKC